MNATLYSTCSPMSSLAWAVAASRRVELLAAALGSTPPEGSMCDASNVRGGTITSAKSTSPPKSLNASGKTWAPAMAPAGNAIVVVLSDV